MRVPIRIWAVSLAVFAVACSGDSSSVRDLGRLGSKSDVGALQNIPFTVDAGERSNPFRVETSGSFKVVIAQSTHQPLTVIVSGAVDGESDEAEDVEYLVEVGSGEVLIEIANHGSHTARGTLSLVPTGGSGPDPEPGELTEDVIAAARENLRRIAKEIDPYHLAKYDLEGPLEDQFITALNREYADHPDQLVARMQALASAVFFAAPEIAPPANGRPTPFHGMDMDDFGALMTIHDQVFNHLLHEKNDGILAGVRPFSVCETKFQIEKYVKAGRSYQDFDSYHDEYEAYAEGCSAEELSHWYNYRGLGHMRPSWMESNIMERFVRRMVDKCDVRNDPKWADECAEWNEGRLAYRLDRNRQLASRFMFYHPDQKGLFEYPDNPVVLLEDRNGDGVGEFVQEGDGELLDGTSGRISIDSTGEFSGKLRFREDGEDEKSIYASKVAANATIDPDYDPSWIDDPDFGLLKRFSDSTGCTDVRLDENECPLLKRFYVTIDRHENFYSTYSALSGTSYLSSQPSPLVACSITLRQSHHWDSAGTPSGGRAGFIYLFRVPFAQILAGTRISVATLDPGPEVLAIQDLYDGSKKLDMSKVWLDIASLSNNLYSSEHEISKFGIVPGEQIEGLLVIRKPKAMDDD